jgi:hypothetical protein
MQKATTREERNTVGVEFINYVNDMHEGIFMSPKNKEFADYCKYLFAKYQTHMDRNEGVI